MEKDKPITAACEGMAKALKVYADATYEEVQKGNVELALEYSTIAFTAYAMLRKFIMNKVNFFDTPLDDSFYSLINYCSKQDDEIILALKKKEEEEKNDG